MYIKLYINKLLTLTVNFFSCLGIRITVKNKMISWIDKENQKHLKICTARENQAIFIWNKTK